MSTEEREQVGLKLPDDLGPAVDLACVPEQWKHTRVVEEVDDACWVPAAPWSFSALAASETTARADR